MDECALDERRESVIPVHVLFPFTQEVAQVLWWRRYEHRTFDRRPFRSDPVLRRAELSRGRILATNSLEEARVQASNETQAQRKLGQLRDAPLEGMHVV